MSKKSLKKIVITLSKLGVLLNLKIISSVPSHGLIVYKVSTLSDENCRRSLTEISEQCLKSNNYQTLVYCNPVTLKQYALYHHVI